MNFRTEDVERLVAAARAVVDSWAEGDLAGRVFDLADSIRSLDSNATD